MTALRPIGQSGLRYFFFRYSNFYPSIYANFSLSYWKSQFPLQFEMPRKFLSLSNALNIDCSLMKDPYLLSLPSSPHPLSLTPHYFLFFAFFFFNSIAHSGKCYLKRVFASAKLFYEGWVCAEKVRTILCRIVSVVGTSQSPVKWGALQNAMKILERLRAGSCTSVLNDRLGYQQWWSDAA